MKTRNVSAAGARWRRSWAGSAILTGRNWRCGAGSGNGNQKHTDMGFYEEVAVLVNKDMGTETNPVIVVSSQGVSQNMIREKLIGVIQYLLENNFEKLCNAMYRLDVSERKFHEVLTGNSPENISSQLADLVIEREMQKVRTRELYKNREM